jgi:hypothetical protein
VGCSHAGGCPLFPLLRASLQSWRDYYCDSDDRWHDCARYKLSLTGELVPISLLPNGRDAGHLRQEADDYWSSTTQRPAPPPPPRPAPAQELWRDPWSQPNAPWFEPAPPPTRPPGVNHRPRPMPGPRVTVQVEPDQHAVPKQGWWARLVDWMKGPV